MIKGLYGSKLTPKQKAQEIIADLIYRAPYWREDDANLAAMTQREVDEVGRHIDQLMQRLVKMGFEYKS